MSIPIGVVGAGGYLGGELLRLLAAHPEFDIAYVGGSAKRTTGSVARRVCDVHPNLRDAGSLEGVESLRALVIEVLDVLDVGRRCAVVMMATPPEVSAEIVPQLLDAGVEVVVDLSPAHRLGDAEEHARCYPGVERDPTAAAIAVYGLPELARERLASARLIASPGCFATAITLAMLPLRELDELVWSQASVDAKSGSTGSGNALRPSGMHALRSNVVSPYKPIGHRHGPEVMQSLRDCGVLARGQLAKLTMSAYGIDAVRGLSVGVHIFIDSGLDEAELRDAFTRTYRDEPFVRVHDGAPAVLPLPDPKAVIGSNFCDVGAFADTQIGCVVLVAALDNMIKGGAGQAIQACNVRCGLPERMGLNMMPLFPA